MKSSINFPQTYLKIGKLQSFFSNQLSTINCVLSALNAEMPNSMGSPKLSTLTDSVINTGRLAGCLRLAISSEFGIRALILVDRRS